MIYLNAFIFAGLVCLVAQLILDNTKLTPGHITCMFVTIGAFLDVFDIYDKIVLWAGGGALVPITSFGHLITHGSLAATNDYGMMGLLIGPFDLTSAGISAAIIISFIFSLIFKPRD